MLVSSSVLAVHLGQQGSRPGLGKKRPTLMGGNCGRIAHHQHLYSKTTTAASSFIAVEHSSMTMSLASRPSRRPHNSKLGFSPRRLSLAAIDQLCIVEVHPSQPLRRSTIAPLPGKAAKATLPSTVLGEVAVDVVFPIPQSNSGKARRAPSAPLFGSNRYALRARPDACANGPEWFGRFASVVA